MAKQRATAIYRSPKISIADSRTRPMPKAARIGKGFIEATIAELEKSVPQLADFQYVLIENCSGHCYFKVAKWAREKHYQYSYSRDKHECYIGRILA